MLIALLLWSLSAQAATDPRPYLMVSVGDSITAAFAANTHAARQPEITNYSFKPVENKDTLSWATGEEVNSHAVRLGKYLLETQHASLIVANVARTTDKFDDLDRQAGLVLDAWHAGDYRALTYMTFLLGANDACSRALRDEPSLEDNAAKIVAFFDKISVIKQDEPIHVLVSLLPRIPDLELPAISDHKTLQGATCHQMHLKWAPLCKGMMTWQGSDEYLARVRLVDQTNAMIENTIREKVAPRHPQFEFAFSNAFNRAAIDTSLLAMDCFHPNQKGQTLLSELTWAQVPWFH